MPTRMQLTKNAQIFRAKAGFSDDKILTIFDAASLNKEAGTDYDINRLREEKRLDGFDYKYSLRVYPSSRPVYFIDEELQDRIYAFILLVEYDDHLIIFKKSCANVANVLNEHFELIANKHIFASFDDDSVDIQKILLRNMTVADRAIRARSFEAVDLKGVLSLHSAGRSIPAFLRIRDGGAVKTISVGTGRVVESSQRQKIDDIARWSKHQVELLKRPTPNNDFLDSFAKNVELQDVLEHHKPTSVLIEAGALIERIHSNDLIICLKRKGKNSKQIPTRTSDKLFLELEQIMELDNDGKVNGRENTSIKINDKTITLDFKGLSRLRIIENAKEITLQSYIVRNGLYSVSFSDPKYMYFMGACYEDVSGVSEIDSILKMLKPQNDIATVIDEKGKFTPTSTKFEDNTMFDVVENLHSGDDYIFCDDLGNEWADHITFNKGDACISFIHSKHKAVGNGASPMQDVVGQAVKNLGNMFFTKEKILNKVTGIFSQKYKNDSVVTDIPRTRIGDPAKFEECLDEMLSNYALHRKCILSCSFLSKSSITTEFTKIKNGQAVKGNIVQLFWILSSFSHAVRDTNAIPIIYCQD